jgi:hypothetical protein
LKHAPGLATVVITTTTTTTTVVRAAGKQNKTLNSGPPGLGVFIIPRAYEHTKSKKTKKSISIEKHADRAGIPLLLPPPFL